MADDLFSKSKVFHLHKEEFLACFYEIALSASVSRKFPGQFQVSLREKSKVPENVHRRCFWRHIWEQKVLSRQSGKREGARSLHSQLRVSTGRYQIHHLTFPCSFSLSNSEEPNLTCGIAFFNFNLCILLLLLAERILYTIAGLREPCSSA